MHSCSPPLHPSSLPLPFVHDMRVISKATLSEKHVLNQTGTASPEHSYTSNISDFFFSAKKERSRTTTITATTTTTQAAASTLTVTARATSLTRRFQPLQSCVSSKSLLAEIITRNAASSIKKSELCGQQRACDKHRTVLEHGDGKTNMVGD